MARPAISLKEHGRQGPAVISVFSNAYGDSNVTDTSLTPGHQVTFELTIANAVSFNGLDLFLYYDPSVLNATSADASTGTVFNNPLFALKELSPGVAHLVVVNLGSTISVASGTLVHVNFKVTGLGVSPLTLGAGMTMPSNFANSWTRLVLGSTPLDVITSDGYFKNIAGKSGPTASFTFSPLLPARGGYITFNASSSFDPDNHNAVNNGVLRFIWDFGANGNNGGLTTNDTVATHSYGPSGDGNFSVRLTVVDLDNGFQGMQVQRLIIAQRADLPPTASFSASSLNVTVGLPVSFDASASNDPDGSIVRYAWDFGDRFTGFGPQVVHSFSTPGNYLVGLTVTDNAGLTGTKFLNISVTTGPSELPPVARFAISPSTPITGERVVFDGTLSSDPDGFIQTWVWGFGDGSSLEFGPFVFHSYSSAGNFTVTLTVTDNAGLADRASQLVQANARPAHGVAVVFVNAQPPTAISGQLVSIEVGIVNNGGSSEVVNVTAYYDSHIAASSNLVPISAPGPGPFPAFTDVRLVWNTNGVVPGNYTISATVFLADDLNPANNHLSDGSVTILPPPTLKLTPNSGSLGTQVLVHGSGFPSFQFGPSELLISFDDQFQGFAFPRNGTFDFTFNVPHADPNKPHLVKAFDPFSQLTISADFHVLPEPLSQSGLAVTVTTALVYFPGDTAVIYILTTSNGSPAASVVQVRLFRPDGSSVALIATSVATGLYKATYAVPRTGSMGTYAIVATASLNGQNTAALASFEVKPAWLSSQSGRTTTTGLALVGIVVVLAFVSWKGYGGRRKEDNVLSMIPESQSA